MPVFAVRGVDGQVGIVAASGTSADRGNSRAHDRILRLVAQDCILPYRGFAIRKFPPTGTCAEISAPCRIQFGDTAD